MRYNAVGMRGSARKIAVVGGKPPAAPAPYGRRAPRHAGGRTFGAPRQSASEIARRGGQAVGHRRDRPAEHERGPGGKVYYTLFRNIVKKRGEGIPSFYDKSVFFLKTAQIYSQSILQTLYVLVLQSVHIPP